MDDDDSSFVLSLSLAINGYVEYALSESAGKFIFLLKIMFFESFFFVAYLNYFL